MFAANLSWIFLDSEVPLPVQHKNGESSEHGRTQIPCSLFRLLTILKPSPNSASST